MPPSPSRLQRVLRTAGQRLGPNGEHWIKKRYERDGSYCLAGAIRAATPDVIEEFYSILLVQQAIQQWAGAKYGQGFAVADIVTWNDAPKRTWSDIQSVLMTALDLVKESNG